MYPISTTGIAIKGIYVHDFFSFDCIIIAIIVLIIIGPDGTTTSQETEPEAKRGKQQYQYSTSVLKLLG